MALHYQISPAVALTDTTEKSLGSITVTGKARKLIGVWCLPNGGAGNTTLENVSGKFRLTSPDVSLEPAEFPLPEVTITGTGVSRGEAKVWPLDVMVPQNAKIEALVTLDLAQTINSTARFGIIVEGA